MQRFSSSTPPPQAPKIPEMWEKTFRFRRNGDQIQQHTHTHTKKKDLKNRISREKRKNFGIMVEKAEKEGRNIHRNLKEILKRGVKGG